jgi:hypothetical protein
LNSSSENNKIRFYISFFSIVTLIYSVLRYNIFGNVPLTDIPSFIFNKSISFTLIAILPLVYFSCKNGHYENSKSYINALKAFTLMHVLLSVSLLSQNYYAKLFSDNKLTLNGNIAVFSGALAFVSVFYMKKKDNYIFYILVSVHLFFLGYKGWLEPDKWNGMMPPITLICFLIVLVMIFIKLRNKSAPQKANINKP